MRIYTDWSCRLLPMMRDYLSNPRDSVEALNILRERCGITRFCMMPEFDCRLESVSGFLVRRERSMSEIRELLPAGFWIRAAGASLLCPGLSETVGLHKLYIPSTSYLPLRLPFQQNQPWAAVELNRLLYHTKHQLLFLSFDLYSVFYPSDLFKRLLELPGAAYQFSYQSLILPEIQTVLHKLIQRNAPILFGTSVNSVNKACYYEFDYFLQTAAEQFTTFERDALFFQNRIYRKRMPV